MILKKVILENFKCYKKATINFKNLSIIVGENNSGKSCLIESLRLISKAIQGATKKKYLSPPNELSLPAYIRGFFIDTQKLKIDLSTIIYYYNASKYAKITAFFADKTKAEIYLNQEIAFAILYDKTANLIKNKKQAEILDRNIMAILPQLSPLRGNEKYLSKETVMDDMDTYLSSLHFRNEINLLKDEYFDDFKKIAEDSWSGLRIDPIEYNPIEQDFLNLYVQDNGFPSEIGKMGNGLQLWLQIMWFLARSKNSKLIILDEPDIYMHPDMQRKVFEFVKLKFPQVIVATHSLEIISMVDPDNILQINKTDKTMRYATDSKSVQKVIDDIGGIQNFALLKLGKSRKCLFVEGKDIKILNIFSEILFHKQLNLPLIPIGGFNNIPRVYGTSNLFYKETDNQIQCIAIVDRDYRDPIVINKISQEAEKEYLNLHVWERKEIENYLIVPEVLYELIPVRYHIKYEDFLLQLDSLLDSQKDDVFDSFSTQYRQDCKYIDEGQQWDIKTCNQKARNYIAENWTDMSKKISLVGGKDFLKLLNLYYSEHYKITFTLKAILDAFKIEWVPSEIKAVLEMLQ